MKWYDSVKVKLLGFFLIISVIFLISIITAFFFIRENNLEKNATAASTLATSSILQHIKISQTKAEVITLTLASVIEKGLENNKSNDDSIVSILYTDKENSINIVSGGVWFEPYVIDKNTKDSMSFYTRNSHNEFERVDNYLTEDSTNYREMEFYKIARQIKSGYSKWTSVYVDPVTHIPMITVVSPIYHKDKFIGTASIDIKIGRNNTKFWDHVESKNIYLMMTDQKGNFIGKSKKLNEFIKDKNIYAIQNKKFSQLFEKLEPVLSHSIKHIHKEKDDLLNKIYFIENDPVFNQKSIVAVYHFDQTHWNVIIVIPQKQVMAQNDYTFHSILAIVVILTLLATISGYLILHNLFVKPIQSINEQLNDNLTEDSLDIKLLGCKDHGEIGLLVDNLNHRTTALKESQDREEKEIIKSMKSEKMLLQQSKMAAMGEMMDAVAHQWKQPLNALSMYSDIIKSDFDEGTVDKKYIDLFRDDIQVQIDHMVNTLDEFRTFFRPNKEHEMFSLLSIVHSVLFLTKDDLLKNRITVNIEQKDHIDVDGSSNEFKHLLLNIINNAKDAFNDNKIEKRVITIRLINHEESKKMEIEDNAGGIPEDIIEDIFHANITSKEEGKGTGIGLYMSTQIATKHNAELLVKNQNAGACFTIAFKS